MFTTRCLYCDVPLLLEDQHLRRQTRCPSCGQFFVPEEMDLDPLMIVQIRQEEEARRQRADGGQATILTAPHTCQSCREPIPTPIGRSRYTLPCPVCNRKTSLYAVLHFCRSCSHLLESPTSLVGREVGCPSCGTRLRVPHTEIDCARDGEVAGQGRLVVECPNPSCRRALVTATDQVGSHAVCPVCRVPFTIPRHGSSHAITTSARPLDPSEAIQRGVEMHCPHCGLLTPRRAGHCPRCGQTL